MEAGGNLYIESSDIGKDHNGTQFMSYLGFDYINDGGEYEVAYIDGLNNSMSRGLQLNYFGGESPHYSVDHIMGFAGAMFTCDQGLGRMVSRSTPEFNVVSSSVVMGALVNGDSLNLKPYLLAEMIFDFMDYDPYTSIQEQSLTNIQAGVYPNPFITSTTIDYLLNKTSEISLSIFNIQGQLIRNLFQGTQQAGKHSVVWDRTNTNNEGVKSGMYFYSIEIEGGVVNGKITAQ